jgi:hypothetical protein
MLELTNGEFELTFVIVEKLLHNLKDTLKRKFALVLK